MSKIKIEFEVEITPDQMSDILVAAFEGGINYWCRKIRIINRSTLDIADYLFASDAISNGYTLELYDAESNDTWDLDEEKMLNGIKKYMIEESISSIEDLMDNHDADVADKIVQYALFNEQMFA